MCHIDFKMSSFSLVRDLNYYRKKTHTHTNKKGIAALAHLCRHDHVQQLVLEACVHLVLHGRSISHHCVQRGM